jgi:hypothetical protein
MKLLLVLSFLFSFGVNANLPVYNLLPTGEYKGVSNSESCLVISSVNDTKSIFQIKKASCNGGRCALFHGQERMMNGGGCTEHLYQTEFGSHLTNGKFPQGAPNFCSRKYKPVSIRVLKYKTTLKVEILSNKHGSLISSCTIPFPLQQARKEL